MNYASGFFFICLEDKTAFLALRSEQGSEPYTWANVGGKVEHGEDSLQAAEREVQEEMGSLPESYNIIQVLNYKKPGFQYTCFVADVPKAVKTKWKPVLNEEHVDAKWFDKLPKDLHPNLEKTLIGYYRNN